MRLFCTSTTARAVAIVTAWLGASFSGEERFARKISKIALLEGGLPVLEKSATLPAAAAPMAGHGSSTCRCCWRSVR